MLALVLVVVSRGAAYFLQSAHLEAGTLLATDLRGHALAVINVASGQTRRIALDGGPHELLPLPDGRVVASLEQAGALPSSMSRQALSSPWQLVGSPTDSPSRGPMAAFSSSPTATPVPCDASR